MARKNRRNEAVQESPVETAQAIEAGEGVNPIVKAGHTLESVMEQNKNWSNAIRFLASQGFKTGDIAKFLDKRYQHVRNVLNQKMKSKATPAAEPSTE